MMTRSGWMLGAVLFASAIVSARGFTTRVAAAQTTAAPPSVTLSAADFPPSDTTAYRIELRGLEAKRASVQLAQAPDATETLTLLLGQERVDDALNVLARIVAGKPAQMADAFAALYRADVILTGDQSKGYDARIRTQIEAARARLPELDNEQRAHLARQLMSAEDVVTHAGSRGYEDRLRPVAHDYPGTKEAALIEVDLLTPVTTGILQRVETLGAFARAHPGTIVGAKAAYYEASQLTVNAGMSNVEPRGSDPTDRFMKFMGIVHDLESGTYPPCEWVDLAPALVARFFTSQPKYSPENVDKTIAAYQQFIDTHPAIDGQVPFGNGTGYIISGKMAPLFKLQGDAAAGVERAFDQLERSMKDPAPARYLRALYYRGGGAQANVALADRPALVQKSDDILAALAADHGGGYARKALATIASQQFVDRDYAHAIETYRKYIAAYPKSDWAWIASIRIAQSRMELGDSAAATLSFRQAASTYATLPLARVLGLAYAGRADEAAGRFDDALADERQALEAWDVDFGLKYDFASTHAALPGQRAAIVDAASSVSKEALGERVAVLTRSLAIPGGAELERGRWQLQQQQWDDARRTFEDAIARYPRSAVVADARTLAHRARLEHALVLADVEDPAHDEAAALKELEALSHEPPDFNVYAAAIARAAILWKQGATPQAHALMKDALAAWHAAQPLSPAPARGSVDEDVVGIRDVVFRPTGGGVYGTGGWNAFTWPTVSPAFLVVEPDLSVKLATGAVTRVTSYRPMPGLDNVIFATADQIQFFTTMISRLGGNMKRAPTQVMQTPNQPVGPSMDILALINQFFAARPGHWGGWEFETYPVLGRIEFLNPERTKATAAVTIGYSGVTVVLEKNDGVWLATGLTNRWIT